MKKQARKSSAARAGKSPARKTTPKGKATPARKSATGRKSATRPATVRARAGKPAEVVAAATAQPVAVSEMPATPESTGARFVLEASCTLREAEDLHFSLLAVKHDADRLSIDAGAVERIDTAGLQLLACFTRARVAAGGSVAWSAVSPEFARCAGRLGLGDTLGLPPTASGDAP